MRIHQPVMRPQDVVILLKIITFGTEPWQQKPLAEQLCISQSEISQSLSRSKYAGLLDPTGKKVRRLALMEFIQFGIAYVFPQQPGPLVRGIPTAHAASPLIDIIRSTESYVWPSGKGTIKGQAIAPLYPAVKEAIKSDQKLHELLALVDAIRVGRSREKEIAIVELKKRILDGE